LAHSIANSKRLGRLNKLPAGRSRPGSKGRTVQKIVTPPKSEVLIFLSIMREIMTFLIYIANRRKGEKMGIISANFYSS